MTLLNLIYSVTYDSGDRRLDNPETENTFPNNSQEETSNRLYGNSRSPDPNNVIRTLAQMDSRIPFRFISDGFPY